MDIGAPSVKDSKNKLSIMEGILPANLMFSFFNKCFAGFNQDVTSPVASILLCLTTRFFVV